MGDVRVGTASTEVASPAARRSELWCRVTVVGGHHEVDLALPAHAPIGDYVLELADLCGEDDHPGLPSAWSLCLPAGAPLSGDATLAGAGVPDGQRLYLRDTLADEHVEPVVREMAEVVAEDIATARAWNAWTIGQFLIVAGAAGLAAVASATVGSGGRTGPLTALTGLTVTAALLVAVAVAHRRLGLPPLVGVAVASCAGLAGAVTASTLDGADRRVAFAALGVMVVAVAALAGAPTAEMTTGAVVAVLGGILAIILAEVGAMPAAAAAGVVVVGYLVLCALPSLCASLVSWLRAPSADEDPTDPTSWWGDGRASPATSQVRALLAGCSVVISLMVVVALGFTLMLARLTTAAGRYESALVACVALSALLRCLNARVALVGLPAAAVGGAGLVGELLVFGSRTGPTGAGASGAAVVAAAVALYSGMVVVRLRRRPSATRPRPGNSWTASLSAMLAAASVPLLAGALGAYDHLLTLGSRL
jgi:type VII secretion integral membrane protein EccD